MIKSEGLPDGEGPIFEKKLFRLDFFWEQTQEIFSSFGNKNLN